MKFTVSRKEIIENVDLDDGRLPDTIILEGEPVEEHIHDSSVKPFEGRDYCRSCVAPHPQPIEEIDIVTEMSSSAPVGAVVRKLNELIRHINKT